MQKYIKRAIPVQAIQLNLELFGGVFTYKAWGGMQTGKEGDWLVKNLGEVYTVDKESFANTYQEVREGFYIKVSPIWAEQATASGAVKTKEGFSAYVAGDWLVSNKEDGSDAYTIKPEIFEELYVEE